MNVIKMTILPKAIYRFSPIPIKTPGAFFYRTRTYSPKNCIITQKVSNSENDLKKAESITLPDSKLYCKITVTKTIWYCHKNRHIDQWNGIDSPEMNPLYMVN